MNTTAGTKAAVMTEEAIRETIRQAVAGWGLAGRRVLVAVPDQTRTCPLGMVFRLLHEAVGEVVAQLDVMIALGTHPPLTDAQIYERLEMTEADRRTRYARVNFFNHAWNDPAQLTEVGRLTRDEVAELTEGRFALEVVVTCNRRVRDYDVVLIVGPVFPHEVVGFSGGNKYLFPGISGPEVLNFFHWLGAVITNPDIIGYKQTPVRAVIDRSAAMIPAERRALCMVVEGKELAGLYAGDVETAWSRAADHSARLHIREVAKPFHTVFAVCPPMYDELWTAGKCMYKSEPAVADGGRVIIYAPHLHEVSVAHGRKIFELGYHTRDYFLQQWDRFQHEPWGVLAHSTHVKGIGTYVNGREQPRVEVVLASRISEADCRRLNLGYLDPDAVDPRAYQNRENEGILYIPKAGEILYRYAGRSARTSR
jgi:nickel-dependent lactate racemase